MDSNKIKMFQQKFIDTISLMINKYYTEGENKINGALWEKILYISLQSNGDICEYNQGSHMISTDIISESFKNISLKGGTYSLKNNTLKFSGSRTTKYSTINEKINFLKSTTDNIIFSLSKSSSKSDDNYYLIIFNSKQLKDNFPNEFTHHNKNYKGMIQ